jgi:GrpB-like predicted nucleotidyltransferase (UPF0157 family)
MNDRSLVSFNINLCAIHILSYDCIMKNEIPVIIEDYNPAWVDMFEEEKEHILSAIGCYCTTIEHIGSTAVPGLAAKPVIDILIGVHHLQDAPLFIPPLVEMGYKYIPEYEKELPERRYLQKIVAGLHTHHLHNVEPDTQFFRTHLAFRDYLRAHPETARKYSGLKKELAMNHAKDRSAYTDGKSTFVQTVIRKALDDNT